jgi:serine/threonine-protein kinase HipA
MRCGRASAIARRQNIVASAAVFGLTEGEATEIIDDVQAVVAAKWERDVRRQGATDADVAAIAPAFGNPGFEYEVAAPSRARDPRRRRDG